jgi:hypothetical protein
LACHLRKKKNTFFFVVSAGDESLTPEVNPIITKERVSSRPAMVEAVDIQETIPAVTTTKTPESTGPLYSGNVKKTIIPTVTTFTENPRSCIPQTISLLSNPVLKAQRRRESLRTVANFFTEEQEFIEDMSSNFFVSC